MKISARLRSPLMLSVLRVVAAVFAMLAVLGAVVDRYGQQDRAVPADAIVVLGSRVTETGVPGDSLHARTGAAVALYRRRVAPALLFTGGVGDYPPSEAAAASTLAIQLGVPTTSITREEMSTSTWENVVNAAEICRRHGWKRVVVVSDPYHLLRAVRNFRKVGLDAYPSPARNCTRNRILYQRANWAVRDGLLLVRDWLSGRA